uniref:SUZ domain-containing protein n=1 Tax=Chrysolophus pictus TaxID=9089 RepID=A0A8C3LU58_CHRPC
MCGVPLVGLLVSFAAAGRWVPIQSKRSLAQLSPVTWHALIWSRCLCPLPFPLYFVCYHLFRSLLNSDPSFLGFSNQFKKFPQMTSYHRMLLHRVAAYFGMDHNVDQTGKAVIINKTSNTRIPEQRFSEHIKDEKNAEFPQRFILKRDDTSMDRDDNQIRLPLQDGRRSKSIEEREEEYQRARERIFARETGQNGYLTDSRGNRDALNRASGSRQSSTESEIKSLEPRPWSSTDSDGSIRSLRPPVTKASSFSGISILTRGDSIGSSKGSTAGRASRAGLVLGAPEACSQPPSSQPSRGLLPCASQQPQPPPPQQPPPQPQGLPPTPQQQPAISNHMISQADELSNPFGQISLSRQGSTEAPDPSSAMFQSSLISQHPQQAGFIMATPGQPIPTSNYSASGHTVPTQQVLQPQGYIQPPQQIQVSYYPPGQYPNSSQQYRSLSHPVAYSSQRTQQLPQQAQQPGLQPMMSNQQQTYQGVMGVQQAQSPGLLNSQRNSMGGQMQSVMGVQQTQPPSLLSSQRSSMGSQMQGLMVQYTPLPSYQVPVANESQSVVQQPFQQPVLVPASQSVQGGLQTGGVPIYYSVIPTAQQNGTSPSVGFLQPPGSEQYQMPQSPSPCSPSQMQQQYSGVSPSGPGVVVMQLNVPNGPQPPQSAPVVQWSHCKYYSLEQRGQKPGDLYNPDTGAQASTQLNSPITSPTQSPTPSPVTNLNSVCTGLSPLPVLTQFPRPMGPAQGDGRYSLLGQPLQYNLSICPPPLLHNQPNYSAHQVQPRRVPTERSRSPPAPPHPAPKKQDKMSPRPWLCLGLCQLPELGFVPGSSDFHLGGAGAVSSIWVQPLPSRRSVTPLTPRPRTCCTHREATISPHAAVFWFREGTEWDETREPEQETGPQVSIHRPGDERCSAGPRAGGDGPPRGHHADGGRQTLHSARHGRRQNPVAQRDSGAARGRRRLWGRHGDSGKRPAHRPRCLIHHRGRVPQPLGSSERFAPPQQLPEPLQTARGQKELRPAGAGARQLAVGLLAPSATDCGRPTASPPLHPPPPPGYIYMDRIKRLIDLGFWFWFFFWFFFFFWGDARVQ